MNKTLAILKELTAQLDDLRSKATITIHKGKHRDGKVQGAEGAQRKGEEASLSKLPWGR